MPGFVADVSTTLVSPADVTRVEPRMQIPRRLAPDGRALLNLGCGWKMHRSWNNLDFSPYARLAHHSTLVKVLSATRVLSPMRQARLAQVDPGIVHWDLKRGIPFPDATFDVVYHSHFLEHLDRTFANRFLAECGRVLKVGGVIRVVVPDWELLTHAYLDALAKWDAGAPAAEEAHSRAMYDLIAQMVRSDATGTTHTGLLGKLENQVRGGAAGTGELHKWMYDRQSLRMLLESAGLRDTRQETARTSRVAEWVSFGLDLDEAGRDYKPESLYMEALK